MGNIRSQVQSTDVGYRLNTDGLLFFIDANNPRSYPGSYNNIYDLSSVGFNIELSGSNLPAVDGESIGTYINSSGVPFFYFDGASASSSLWFKIPNPNLIFTASIEMVVSTEQYGGQGIFGMLTGFNTVYFFMQQGDGSVGFTTGNGDLQGFNRTFTSPSVWPLNKWTYVVAEMVRLGSQSDLNILSNKIYVNGVLQPSSARGINGPTPAGQARTFGNGNGRIANAQWTYQNQPGGGYQTNISCSIFRVYNRALTQDEINKNYNHLKPIYNLL